MCASPLSLLRAGPPPPKVALLSDALFFTRVVPVTSGATPAEAAAQVELALEANAPFPLAQLYYGWYWPPGSDRALVYASYRRRFTGEQTAAWADAELVLPVSAALLGAPVEPATSVLLHGLEGITAIYWETSGVPAQIVFHPVDPETDDDARAKARDDVLRAFGGSKAVIDLQTMPAPGPATSDREIVFHSGDFAAPLPAALTGALDVRDKGQLATLRAARQRDVVLWRVACGCAAALAMLFVLEFALLGGQMWQRTRLVELNSRKPKVDRIVASAEMANYVEDLVNRRLLPLEMMTVLVGEDSSRKPADITFTRIETRPAGGLNTLYVSGQTSNTALVPAYVSQLKALPEVENVTSELGGGLADRFELVVTFKPDVLKLTL